MAQFKRLTPRILLMGALLVSPSAFGAQIDSFYNAKTVRIIVGSTPGGLYDRWARLLARYIPKVRFAQI